MGSNLTKEETEDEHEYKTMNTNIELISNDVFLCSVARYTDPKTFFTFVIFFFDFLAQNINHNIRFTKKMGSKIPKFVYQYVYWLDLSHDFLNSTFEDIKMFPKLKILNIDNCIQMNDGMSFIMQQLIDLSCRNCPNLTEESFREAKNLTYLDVSNNIDYPSKIIKYLENIKILHMSNIEETQKLKIPNRKLSIIEVFTRIIL